MVAFSRFSRYFDALAARGSIRRAAERLNVAPSAVDRQLLLAEEELGTALFERLPQGLRLTAAGELLVHALRNWQRDYRRVLSQIDELRGLRRGTVRVAAVEGTTQDLVPDLLARFAMLYPTISCEIRVLPGDAVERQVLSGDADIGLTFNPPEAKGLRVDHKLRYRMGALLLPEHPLAARPDPLRLSDLADHPVILPDETTSLRRVLDDALRRSGVTLRPVAVVNQMALIRALVLRGAGIGLLTEIGALPEIRAGRILFRPLADRSIRPSFLCALSAEGRHLPVPVALFARELGDAMASVALSGAAPADRS